MSRPDLRHKFDMILVGGGLSAALTAHRTLQLNPNLQILLTTAPKCDSDTRTWSFHGPDAATTPWLTQIADAAWDQQTVRFSSYERVLKTPYYSIREPALLNRLENLENLTFNSSSPTTLVDTGRIQLANGIEFYSDLILDSRPIGIEGLCGYQKFVGVHLRTKKPHGVRMPLLMDASIEQKSGYRFIYVLPFDKHNILIEDTRYSRTPEINQDEFTQDLLDYQIKNGWAEAEVIAREVAALPIPLQMQKSDIEPHAIGVRGGFFHPVTGYSISLAAKTAETIAQAILKLGPNRGPVLNQIRRLRAAHQNNLPFFLTLNRLMFLAADDHERFRIFENFYRLPKESIDRFYSGQLTPLDKTKIFSGRPPVNILRALKVIWQGDQL